MSIGDRIRNALSGDSTKDADSGAVEGPAAAAGLNHGDQSTPSRDEDEVSSAGSGAEDVETSAGGADAVPDTPDGVAEDYT